MFSTAPLPLPGLVRISFRSLHAPPPPPCASLSFPQFIHTLSASSADATTRSLMLQQPINEALQKLPATMKRLHLCGNDQFSGSMGATYVGPPNIEVLTLEGNALTGSIPSFAAATGLLELDMSHCGLSGHPLPIDFSALTQLEILRLSFNEFVRRYPGAVGRSWSSARAVSGGKWPNWTPAPQTLATLEGMIFTPLPSPAHPAALPMPPSHPTPPAPPHPTPPQPGLSLPTWLYCLLLILACVTHCTAPCLCFSAWRRWSFQATASQAPFLPLGMLACRRWPICGWKTTPSSPAGWPLFSSKTQFTSLNLKGCSGFTLQT